MKVTHGWEMTFVVSGTLMPISQGRIEIGFMSGTFMKVTHGWEMTFLVSGTLMPVSQGRIEIGVVSGSLFECLRLTLVRRAIMAMIILVIKLGHAPVKLNR